MVRWKLRAVGPAATYEPARRLFGTKSPAGSRRYESVALGAECYFSFDSALALIPSRRA